MSHMSLAALAYEQQKTALLLYDKCRGPWDLWMWAWIVERLVG